MCHAWPRPVPVTAVPMLMASGTGQVSGVEKLTEEGSLDMKRTATCPSGSPDAGTVCHCCSPLPATGMRPNWETGYFVVPYVTVMLTGLPQLFAMNTAQQGGAMPGSKDGVACTKSQPMVPLLFAAAAHAGTHAPAKHPRS